MIIGMRRAIAFDDHTGKVLVMDGVRKMLSFQANCVVSNEGMVLCVERQEVAGVHLHSRLSGADGD